jgi:hypothetical protein
MRALLGIPGVTAAFCVVWLISCTEVEISLMVALMRAACSCCCEACEAVSCAVCANSVAAVPNVPACSATRLMIS